MAHLQVALENVNVIPGAVSLITDAKGMVLASTAEYAILRDMIQDNADLSEFSSTVFNNDEVIDEFNINGIDSVVVANKINLIGGGHWYFITSVQKDIAYASVIELSKQQIMWSVFIVIIFVLILIVVFGRIDRPVLALKSLVASLSSGDGDLTQRLTVKTKDDLGEIANGINAFIENLHAMILEIKSVTTNLSDGVVNLRSHSSENTNILNEHQLETNQVVTAVEELSATAELVADNASEAAQFTQEANQVR